MMLKMSVTPDDSLKRKIDALVNTNAKFKLRVSEVVRVNAFDVVARAIDLVPTSTGMLRRSIQATFFDFGLSALIGSFLPYAARQEFDATLDHSVRPPRRRKVNTSSGRKGTIIKGTGQSNPKATFGFIRKALAAVKPRFLADLRQAVGEFGTALGS